MKRFGDWLRRTLPTPFGFAVLGCLVLAGWALWTGGLFDGPIARHVRTSSVYAAPGTGLDTAAAERIIGNRRLIVILLEPGADLRDGCDAVRHAASGTLVLLMRRDDDGDGFDTYGCSMLPGHDDENFGRAFVAETSVGSGVDPFADRPLDAIKVIAVNYDRLAKADMVPTDARTISPSLPRYLVAIAAVGAVIVGTAVLYGGARRAGRFAVARRDRLDRATDSRTVLSAATAVVAQQIIDLDARYAAAVRRTAAATRRTAKRRSRGTDTPDFAARYRKLTSEYTSLLDDVTAADRRGEDDFVRFTARAESLAKRFRTLADDRH
ncbi:hypothetical protein GCM10010399_77370 [Dactylosporangium fulvum]|uniref:DUF4350 domain-containing protein n=1 Tax=Dactylosporangium fulvum TaxID=53359 RepID=A0ABY5W4Y3_9ACTN|nr:hypothetical protein [Dactylosporangium fulvum]UWP85068.1 hypothetical protein Dfulv_12900 [Dactylosporangium fulvum]